MTEPQAQRMIANFVFGRPLQYALDQEFVPHPHRLMESNVVMCGYCRSTGQKGGLLNHTCKPMEVAIRKIWREYLE